MKHHNLALLLVVLLIMSSFSGCIMIGFHKNIDIPTDDVVSVQFYDLRAPGISGGAGFHEKYDPVYTVPEAEKEAFLEDFSKLDFQEGFIIVLAAVDPSFYYGDWVVRINFTNGQYSFYSCGGYGETYDETGKRISSDHASCDDEQLQDLIGKYYNIPQKK